MASAGIYGAFGANRRRADVAILQLSRLALWACNARGRKGNYFLNASDREEFIDKGPKQR